MTRRCGRCDDPKAAHEHFRRASSYCGLCDCPKYISRWYYALKTGGVSSLYRPRRRP